MIDNQKKVAELGGGNGGDGMSLNEFESFYREILEQPRWRARADKEMDYKDGNQLDSELLERMKERGIPPAIEPLIGLAIESILGYEAKQRMDWRVIPDADKQGEEVAEAFNYKLNQAERKSRADRACSEAFESQVSVGVGWVEVSKEYDLFKYPYRCSGVHRNEIFWDFNARCPMLSDARYLFRMKWVDRDIAKAMFPGHELLLEQVCNGWQLFGDFRMDGAASTGLAMSHEQERGFSVEEQQWRDVTMRRVRIFEVWYRRWKRVLAMKSPDGRVVEVDKDNPVHLLAISRGYQVQHSVACKVRRSWWAGPHQLSDGPSPYLHSHFPYVPFWGHREDRTGVPYGRIRGMMYMQDNVNASTAKIRWGLSSTVTMRTKGAVLLPDEKFRQMIARPDADVVLDQDHMAKPGATFKVDRNFELNEQQYKMLSDARASIQKIGGISNEFQGVANNSTSGVQFNAQVEQSSQSIADIMDNFKESRAQVGELLLSMIVQDSMGTQEDVFIDGGILKPDKTISLNKTTYDNDGFEYLSNDVSRTMLKVVLDDVPSTPSFRTQQLAALSEAFKASPPEYQRIMMPHMMALMDVPNKKEILDAIKQADSVPSSDQVAQQNKVKELELKASEMQARIKDIESSALKKIVEAMYSSMQLGGALVANPAIANVADSALEAAGYRNPIPSGVDPGFSGAGVAENAQFPPLEKAPSPASPFVGKGKGIETMFMGDNSGAV